MSYSPYDDLRRKEREEEEEFNFDATRNFYRSVSAYAKVIFAFGIISIILSIGSAIALGIIEHVAYFTLLVSIAPSVAILVLVSKISSSADEAEEEVDSLEDLIEDIDKRLLKLEEKNK